MEEKDLIKKLQTLEVPEIEIKSHRESLKMALLNSDYFKKSNFFEIFKRSLAFAVPAALLVIFGINIIQPKLIENRAFGIAKANPEVKQLMEEKDMVLSDIEVRNGKAYVLLNPYEETEIIKEKDFVIKIQKTKEDEIEEIEGAIVEVNLDQKKVAKVNPIKWEDVAPLDNEEKESAREIVGEEEIIKELIPEGAKLERIQSSLPQKVTLIAKDNEIKLIPHPNAKKRAQVFYVFNGKKWIVRVNLAEKRVEEIKYSSGNQNPKGQK